MRMEITSTVFHHQSPLDCMQKHSQLDLIGRLISVGLLHITCVCVGRLDVLVSYSWGSVNLGHVNAVDFVVPFLKFVILEQCWPGLCSLWLKWVILDANRACCKHLLWRFNFTSVFTTSWSLRLVYLSTCSTVLGSIFFSCNSLRWYVFKQAHNEYLSLTVHHYGCANCCSSCHVTNIKYLADLQVLYSLSSTVSAVSVVSEVLFLVWM